MKYLEISMSLEEIKNLNKIQFNKILTVSIQQKALEYLVSKRRSKGKDISHTVLKMADYLMPNYENLSSEDRRRIFEIRNRMLPISDNFPVKYVEEKCWCGEKEDTRHNYNCWKDKHDKDDF